MEKGKLAVRLDKVNQVLRLFGEELQPAKISNDMGEVLRTVSGCIGGG